jgi:hypothetical protein
MQTDPSIHRETLEEEATHATDPAEQVVHLAAVLLVALAMGLMMTPAAYHRQVERGSVSRRFVDLSSSLLTLAMIPLIAGICLDTYLIARLVLDQRMMAAVIAGVVAVVLTSLWFALPAFCRRLKT